MSEKSRLDKINELRKRFGLEKVVERDLLTQQIKPQPVEVIEIPFNPKIMEREEQHSPEIKQAMLEDILKRWDAKQPLQFGHLEFMIRGVRREALGLEPWPVAKGRKERSNMDRAVYRSVKAIAIETVMDSLVHQEAKSKEWVEDGKYPGNTNKHLISEELRQYLKGTIESYPTAAEKKALSGINKKLAGLFQVSEKTIRNWQRDLELGEEGYVNSLERGEPSSYLLAEENKLIADLDSKGIDTLDDLAKYLAAKEWKKIPHL
ncbi:hypothetical protein [Ferrimonas aestuarii]|uniref:Uncharacterized protein n=1 Tax=Ferrimonas aestuarii TaxID=2569539 RepID=A0A4U1BSM1_9GAMM|nr:hypothetical protein [Ferrimonas aestuarii]TKB58360.1 hypothetical protein FCL42_01015 [Ferrimonas aestuarii]